MDGRHKNKVGCKGFDVDSNDIANFYLCGNSLIDTANNFGISHWTVLDRLKKIGVKKRAVYYLDHSSFSIVSKESCFWAGFVFARGYSSNAKISRAKNSIGFETSELFGDYLLDLVRFIKSNLPTRTICEEKTKYIALNINSEQIINDLWNNFGINMKDKSKFSGMIFDCEPELVMSFLRGYLDSSMSLSYKISANAPCLRVSSRSERLISGMLDRCSGLKIKPTCYNKGKYFEVTFYTNQVVEFLKEIFGKNLEFLSEYNKNKLYEINKKIEKNKEEFNKKNSIRAKTKRKNNLQTRLVRACRKRLWDAFKKRGLSKSRDDHTMDLVGCSGSELEEYLVAKFKPGMTCDNYGKWHIDHIKPLSLFNLNDPEQLRMACHYTNLQPLWAEENLSKGARYSGD